MTDYTEFTVALKSSWIRRLFHADSKWIKLLESTLQMKVSELLQKGSDFISNISKRINNVFWKDVFLSWVKIININSQIDPYILNEHIWFNPKVKIDNTSIFLKHYYNAGFVFIKDLLDSDGNFLRLQDMLKLNIKTNFVEYAGLKKAVLAEFPNHFGKKLIGPTLPKSIMLFYKNSKGCKDIYNILLHTKRETITSVKKKMERK